MVDLEALPENVRDLWRQAIVHQDVTTHTRRPGRRTLPRQESWRRELILGTGGYGVVWREKKINDSGPAEVRAVKCISTSAQSDRALYIRELDALAKFSQDAYADSFVKCYGWYETPGWIYISMEYCEHGDLKKYLANVTKIPENQSQEIAAQILGGLTSMHEAKPFGFAHRDVKPANILIKYKPPDPWWIKLCDFGLTKRHESVVGSSTVCGTPGFIPPEMTGYPCKGDPRTANPFSVDMWCLGETLFQMLAGRATFTGSADLHRYQAGTIFFPVGPLFDACVSEDAAAFICALMAPVPEERLHTDAAWKDPWMRAEDDPTLNLGMNDRIDETKSSVHGELHYNPCPSDDDLTQPSGRWSHTTTIRPAQKKQDRDLGPKAAGKSDVTWKESFKRTDVHTEFSAPVDVIGSWEFTKDTSRPRSRSPSVSDGLGIDNVLRPQHLDTSGSDYYRVSLNQEKTEGEAAANSSQDRSLAIRLKSLDHVRTESIQDRLRRREEEQDREANRARHESLVVRAARSREDFQARRRLEDKEREREKHSRDTSSDEDSELEPVSDSPIESLELQLLHATCLRWRLESLTSPPERCQESPNDSETYAESPTQQSPTIAGEGEAEGWRGGRWVSGPIENAGEREQGY